MSKRTLREKLYLYLWNQPVGVSDYSKRLTDRILRLVREEQRRKCANCSGDMKRFVKKLTDIEK